MVDRFQGDSPNQDHTFYSMSKKEEKERQKEVDQVLSGKPMIYERNPDTDEVREREFGMYDEDGMFTSEYLRESTKPEPAPYRNEAAEAVEILARMERKIDALIERMENK